MTYHIPITQSVVTKYHYRYGTNRHMCIAMLLIREKNSVLDRADDDVDLDY